MNENRDTASDMLLGRDLNVSDKQYGTLLSINVPEETERDTFERHDIVSDEINVKQCRHTSVES